MAWGKKPISLPKLSGPGSSIYLGRYFDLGTGKVGSELTYDDERHLLLLGPNGSGKGTRLLVNNLLRLRGRSLVVIDPKGELTAITSDYRRKLGEVVVLNPFNVLELGSAGFNPLAALDPDSPTFIDDASGLGEALVKMDPNEKDPHWSDSARGLITALIMWEVKTAREEKRAPTMERVRYLLTQPNEYERDGEGNRKLVAGLRVTASLMAAKGGFEIESLISRFIRDTDEVASIQSTADRHTSWMLSPLMRANMAQNDIDFATLKERPVTVYLILPAERMRTHAIWLRLVIVSALRALYRPGGLKTLFMLDEFAQLGHLGPLEEAMALVRGYGIQLWPVLQDLNQLKSLYGDRTETFMANAGVVQSFAPNDLVTAEWMSHRSGETTAAVAGYNRGDQQSDAGHGSASTGLSWSQQRRRLFLPQELMELRAGAGMLWPAGSSRSVPFFAPPYWETEVKSLARGNPYYELAGKPVKKAAPPPPKASLPAKAQRKQITGDDVKRAISAVHEAGKKYGPPAMKALKFGATKVLEFLVWAGTKIAKEAPPLARRLKAFAVTQYERMRESRAQNTERKEPGPPLAASRDSGDGTTPPS